jgi:hypothetical protein
MNESGKNAVEGIKVLWPYLSYQERVEWVERLEHLFNNDFITTTLILSGKAER